MSANSITLSGRVAAERIMVDACTITGAPTQVFNDSTGQVVTTPGAQVYAGKCRVRTTSAKSSASGSTPDVGDKPASIISHLVSVPVAVVPHIDDVVTITAAALAGEAVGLTLRIVDVAQGTHLTARRLVCESVER